MKIAIIGSGISAVTAAKSFIDQQYEVYMFEGSKNRRIINNNKLNFLPSLKTSPKFNNELLKQSINDFNQNYNIKTENFFSANSLILGGLSNFWGGGLELPDDNYLKKYNNYKKIIQEKEEIDVEIGLKKDPFEFYNFFFEDKKIKQILNDKDKDVTFEKLLLAINQFNINDKEKQKYLKDCQYTNPNIIYNAKNEIINLQNKKLLNFYDSSFVNDIITDKNKLNISINNSLFPIKFDKVILCCGTVGSAVLISKILNLKTQFRLHHTPVVQLAYFSGLLNHKIKVKEKFGMALLMLLLKHGNHTFKGSFIQASKIDNKFFGVKDINILFSLIKNFIFVGNFFFPHSFSNTELNIKESSVLIKSDNNNEIKEKTPDIKKKLNSFLSKFGLTEIPYLNFKLLMNGSDAHYTSSIYDYNNNIKTIIDENCQVIERKNLYILDNSVIAGGLHYPTYFTMMYIKHITKKIITNDKKN